jgi:hypothetical protein
MENAAERIAECFAVTKRAGAHLFGFYPVANAFYMSRKTTTDLKFICGAAHGYFNRKSDYYTMTTPVKQDYEFTCRNYLADGSVVRFNQYAYKNDYYTLKGGCQEYRTPEMSEESAQMLLKMFPAFVTINNNRKSGFTEILLKHRVPKPSARRKV